MAKFFGKLGFVRTVETRPGIFEQEIRERSYTGDVLSRFRKYDNGNSINGNISIDNEISIVADPFAVENFCFLTYINLRGIKWTVNSVREEYPRLIITLGEVYNGNTC